MLVNIGHVVDYNDDDDDGHENGEYSSEAIRKREGSFRLLVV